MLSFGKTHLVVQTNYIMFLGNSGVVCFIFSTFIMHFLIFFHGKKNVLVAVALNGHLLLMVDFLCELTWPLWVGLTETTFHCVPTHMKVSPTISSLCVAISQGSEDKTLTTWPKSTQHADTHQPHKTYNCHVKWQWAEGPKPKRLVDRENGVSVNCLTRYSRYSSPLILVGFLGVRRGVSPAASWWLSLHDVICLLDGDPSSPRRVFWFSIIDALVTI